MQIKSLLTTTLLALSLGADTVSASKHGRFAQLSRGPMEKAKRAIESTRQHIARTATKYRFLTKNSKREYIPWAITNMLCADLARSLQG